ncbi:MAG: hypothetical protein J7539_06685 [Niabella sp.]|nr:hypothetical protein [Niabella sp.]
MHLINRLQFELTCAEEALALDFRQHFSAVYQQAVTDALEAACDALVGDGEWLRIDKLEIDLGAFSQNSFKRDLETVLRPAFEKELREQIARLPAAGQPNSGLTAQLELWAYFFNNGTLPWWGQSDEIDISSITKELAAQQPGQLQQIIYDRSDKQQFWQRMAFQLSVGARAVVIALVEELQKIRSVFNKWLQLLNPPGLEQMQNTADLLVLRCAYDFFRDSNGSVLLCSFESALAEMQSPGIIPLPDAITAQRSDYLKIYNNEIPVTAIQQYRDLSLRETRPVPAPVNAAMQYLVRHAGIVLLAPFLNPFFSNLQLLEAGQWKAKTMQYRAVHLLRYLSTGQQQVPEYELALEKIICGLAIEEPLPLEMELTAAESTEVEALLSSVISHWAALKNTSVQGLRESFLKRDGIIAEKDTGWLLRVERKTVDVLTDLIPWGYSTLVFPWNEHIIHVEW